MSEDGYKGLGLKHDPFKMSNDTHYFYPTRLHERAYKYCHGVIARKRGIGFVFGPIGAGKSLLAEATYQEESLDTNKIIRLFPEPTWSSAKQFSLEILSMLRTAEEDKKYKTEDDWLEYLKKDLKLRSVIDIKEEIKERLFLARKNKLSVVILIDEANALRKSIIEEIRLWSNVEDSKGKLVQFILFSQDDYEDKMRKIENFWDRIYNPHFLNVLTKEDTIDLINFRLEAAGYKRKKSLFDADAFDVIYEYSNGRPREIIKISSECLDIADMDGLKLIDSELVEEVCSKSKKKTRKEQKVTKVVKPKPKTKTKIKSKPKTKVVSKKQVKAKKKAKTTKRRK